MLDPRRYTIDWLDGEVAGGRCQVFGGDSAVIVTKLIEYPTGARDIHGMVAAGDLAEILELIDQAEAWGREQGCIGAEIASREAWVKIMAGSGYRMHQITICKELG